MYENIYVRIFVFYVLQIVSLPFWQLLLCKSLSNSIFTIFYKTALNKIVIKLTKLKSQDVQLKYLADINLLVIKNT